MADQEAAGGEEPGRKKANRNLAAPRTTDDAREDRNPFGGAVTKAAGAAVTIEMERAVAETQAMMIVAKRFPRDEQVAMTKLLNACTRETLADSALYTYARGGTDITGPSIRLAEAIAQAWGNIQFGFRELEQAKGASSVEAFAWDMESNTRQIKTFEVSHYRQTKREKYLLTDPRDIYEMVANQAARRVRACILGVIPGDVVEAAVSQCEETLNAKADTSPAALQKMLEKFKEFGVTQKMIEKRIQRNLDTIRPAQFIQLRKIYVSMTDGMSDAATWFEVAPTPDMAQRQEATAASDKAADHPNAELDSTVRDKPADAGAAPSNGAKAEAPNGAQTKPTAPTAAPAKKTGGLFDADD